MDWPLVRGSTCRDCLTYPDESLGRRRAKREDEDQLCQAGEHKQEAQNLARQATLSRSPRVIHLRRRAGMAGGELVPSLTNGRHDVSSVPG
jgi:hypothetical protein